MSETDDVRRIVEALVTKGGVTREFAEQIAPGIYRAGIRAIGVNMSDLDLTAIRERVSGDLPITSWIWREDVPALIAEVERLRAEREARA